MRILFDQGTPVPLKQYLSMHVVETAYERGWSQLTNGELLAAAEKEFLVTTDRNLRYQQSLSGRKLAVMVLPTTSWPVLEQRVQVIVDALAAVRPGEYLEIGSRYGS